MNNLMKALLSGAALSALAIPSAVAQQKHPAFALTAMHAGRVVTKTEPSFHCRGHTSCTYTVYTYISSSDYFHKTAPLVQTYYKWNSYSTICSHPKQRVRTQKKSLYGRAYPDTQTYSIGCPSGPTTFYGDTYRLMDKAGEGKVDFFKSSLSGKFRNSNGQYKARAIFAVSVFIDTQTDSH